MGSGKICKRVVVWLATGNHKKTPCAELAGFSRAIYFEIMAIGNPLHEIDRMIILKFGQGKDCDTQRNFEQNKSNSRNNIDTLYLKN